jgi:hypothetical protein
MAPSVLATKHFEFFATQCIVLSVASFSNYTFLQFEIFTKDLHPQQKRFTIFFRTPAVCFWQQYFYCLFLGKLELA